MIRFFLLILCACGGQAIEFAEDCDVRIHEVSPQEGPAGTQVAARLVPVTTIWDTAVYANGERAAVDEIVRENCEACDECKQAEGCIACNDCDACDALCKAECVESVLFTVPSIAEGPAEIVIYNGHGGSNPHPFTVSAATDTGDTASDYGSIDSGLTVDSTAH